MKRNVLRLTLGLAAMAVVLVGLESQANAFGHRCGGRSHCGRSHHSCCQQSCCEEEKPACEEEKSCGCEQSCDNGCGGRHHRHHRGGGCCNSGCGGSDCGCNGGDSNGDHDKAPAPPEESKEKCASTKCIAR